MIGCFGADEVASSNAGPTGYWSQKTEEHTIPWLFGQIDRKSKTASLAVRTQPQMKGGKVGKEEGPSMLHSAYDPLVGRTIEFRCGDFFQEGLAVDILVISARDGYYEPEPGSMVAALKKNCKIAVGELSRAYDFTKSASLKSWISDEITSWGTSRTKFKRLMVIESSPQAKDMIEGIKLEIEVFQRMFRNLSLLPLHNIPSRSVATPLLNTGRQGASHDALIGDLKKSFLAGFKTIVQLQLLVVFDLENDHITRLSAQIDEQLGRTANERNAIRKNDCPGLQDTCKHLVTVLDKLKHVLDSTEDKKIIADLEAELKPDKPISLVAVGISARKLIESLVRKETHHNSDLRYRNLFQQINYLDSSGYCLTANRLHGVRLFGNWMGHASDDNDSILEKHDVSANDLLVMLTQFITVLHCYPWTKKRRLSYATQSHVNGKNLTS